MLPALPALLLVCLAQLSAPIPWVGSGGLPPASPPARPAAATAVPVAVVRVATHAAAPPSTAPRFGPFPLVVGPEAGRSGLSSATLPVLTPGPPGPPVPVPPVLVALPPPVPVLAQPTPPVAPEIPAVAPDVEVDPAGGEWLRQRATEALSQVSFPWRSLGYEVAFLPARSGVRARTLLNETRIEVFARRSDTARQTAFDLAHEIAHAVDFRWGSWEARGRWQEARGFDVDRPWFGCNACPDLSTPAGDFAESFAVWQVPGGNFSSTLGPPPDENQRALLAELSMP